MAAKTPLDDVQDRWAIFCEECASGTHRTYTGAFDAAGKRCGTSRFRLQEQFRRVGLLESMPALSCPAIEMVTKGQSTLVDAHGNTLQRWDKTRMRGLSDDQAEHLPDPKAITRVSTLYDQEGRVTQQWVQERPADIAKRDLWLEFAKALAEPLPRACIVPAPMGPRARDLMALYPFGDHHLGMLSWKYETGTSYDIDIAEQLLDDAIVYLVDAAPACDEAVVAFIGDFMHYDSFETVTPTNRNPLDADGRFPKMVRAAIRTMRRAIERALERHLLVRVIVEIGNHDLASSIFLMEALANIYEHNPRVLVDTSPRHFHFIRFGSNLIATHHGHGVKPEDLPLLMATDQPEDWGATKFRYWITGHIHKQTMWEFNGCTVESLRVLPPPDAWAYNKGYRPMRDMKAILYHTDYGETHRIIFNPSMLERRAA